MENTFKEGDWVTLTESAWVKLYESKFLVKSKYGIVHHTESNKVFVVGIRVQGSVIEPTSLGPANIIKSHALVKIPSKTAATLTNMVKLSKVV